MPILPEVIVLISIWFLETPLLTVKAKIEVVATVLTLMSTYFIAKKYKHAPFLKMLSALLWAGFGLKIGAYGVVVTNMVQLLFNTYAWWCWVKGEK